jgi:hypothetical protein
MPFETIDIHSILLTLLRSSVGASNMPQLQTLSPKSRPQKSDDTPLLGRGHNVFTKIFSVMCAAA